VEKRLATDTKTSKKKVAVQQSTYIQLLEHCEDTDSNDQGIACLKCRSDILVMQDVVETLEGNGYTLADIFFVAGFLHLLYWMQPVWMTVFAVWREGKQAGIKRWCNADPEVVVAIMQGISKDMKEFTSNVTSMDGSRVIRYSQKRKHLESNFDHLCMNPEVRATAWMDWKLLIDDVASSRWQKACNGLGKVVAASESSVSYVKLMGCLSEANCSLYTGQVGAQRSHYNSVHFLRSVCHALCVHSDQSKEDWHIFRDMGNGTYARCKKYGVFCHARARRACVDLAKRLKKPYYWEDLSCYVCLLSHG
jgi:hypothetical protein